jgi:UDP-3-O-[3-hydroxymyristoyl] glucosamine N-acyltransferase
MPTFTLSEITHRLGGQAVREAAQPFTGVGAIESAAPTEITFLANAKYRSQLATTNAGAVIVAAPEAAACKKPHIIAGNPYAYFARVAQLFAPVRTHVAGVHRLACIAPSAKVAASAQISEFASVGENAIVGENVFLGAGVVVGPGASIGEGTVLHARVVLYDGCYIGARGIVHSGAVIGADGFGFAPDFKGSDGAYVKIPQTGGVHIGDDCEIGANTTIDRGTMRNTIVGNGVKLDNQVQLGHNVSVGDHTVISGCVGVAGSTKIGSRVMIGGAASIIGHLEICDFAVIAATTFVTKSIKKPGMVASGMPQMEHDQWLKNAVHLRHLSEMAKQLRELKNERNGE